MNEQDPNVREALTLLLANEGWVLETVDNCEALIETVRTRDVISVIS